MKKKQLLALFTGLCLALLIAGCKENTTPNNDTQGTVESSISTESSGSSIDGSTDESTSGTSDCGSDTWSDENVDNGGWT